jgi:hypothetical protein
MKFYKEAGKWVCVFRGEEYIGNTITSAARLAISTAGGAA